MSAPLAFERCACPLCGSLEDGAVVGTRGRFGMSVRNVVCPTCALVYVNPRPGREAMAEYYAREYRPHFEAGGVGYLSASGQAVAPGEAAFDAQKEAWHQNQAETAFLLGELRPGSRVLEIGCRHARTLAIQRERFAILPFGIEPDLNEAAAARRAGVDCFAGVLEDFEPGELRFDAIQLFHVLEHLHDPLGALLRLRGWLAPAGRLIVEVPNVHQPYGSLEGNFFQNAHLTSLSADTLAALLARAGLRPRHVFDQEVLFVVAEPDPEAGQAPRAFSRAMWLDPSHEPEWVTARLRSYGELFDLTERIRRGELSFDGVDRAQELLEGPCFTGFALDALGRLTEHLAAQGAPRTALELTRSFARGAYPDDAREVVALLASELALLVAEHDRALRVAHAG